MTQPTLFFNESVPSWRISDKSFLEYTENAASISLKMDTWAMDKPPSFILSIDNRQVAEIYQKEMLNFFLQPGEHRIKIKCNGLLEKYETSSTFMVIAKSKIEFRVGSNEPGSLFLVKSDS